VLARGSGRRRGKTAKAILAAGDRILKFGWHAQYYPHCPERRLPDRMRLSLNKSDESMKRLASNEVLGGLSFELDAMGEVLGHGYHLLKARQPRSILNLKTVHRQGRIPITGQT
jgi:hypothetical protein